MGHFSVTGKCLTDTAREAVLADKWEQALRFLDETLHCGLHYAEEIASGVIKLVGEGSYVETAPEDTAVREAYQLEVLHIYRGRFQKSIGGGKTWLRPIACVTNFGEDDSYRSPRYCDRDNDNRGFHRSSKRASFYCERQEEWAVGNAYVPSQGKSVAIICEMCPSAPAWLPKLTLSDAVAQVEHFASALEERGNKQFQAQWGHLDPLSPTVGSLQDVAIRGIKVPRDEDDAHAVEQVNRDRAARIAQQEGLDTFMEQLLSSQREEDEALRQYAELRKDLLALQKLQKSKYTFEAKLDGKTVSVSRDAFFHWALQDTPVQPPYVALAPSGMRLLNDIPAHTDWLCAVVVEGEPDFKPWEHFKELTELGYHERYKVHEMFLQTDLVVLSQDGRESCEGIVVHPRKGESVPSNCIAVIPNASADYVQAACTACATITEIGGNFAHLVVVSEGVVVRVEDARSKYPVGSRVVIDLVARKVHKQETETI